MLGTRLVPCGVILGLVVSSHAQSREGERERIKDRPGTPAVRTAPSAIGHMDGVGGSQVNVASGGLNVIGDAGNEPSIAIDPQAPNRIVIGWRQFDTIASNFREAGVNFSVDGGRTWSAKSELDSGVFRSDPVLDSDLAGNFYYHSLTQSNGEYSCQLFKSIDRGVTWQGPIQAFGGDKAWFAVDKTGLPSSGQMYAAWDYAGCCGDDWFNRSTDGGLNWSSPGANSNHANLGGAHHRQRR